MISPTRLLCQKYTDLSDAEIACIESYNHLIPALANAERSDVFIDCRTATGRSAIVVCEAKPQTVPSNYEGAILGTLIRWENEPAVDRSFRLGVPTVDMRAISMPEDRRIVQSVEPIFYNGRLIAVLIYERPASPEDIFPAVPETRHCHVPGNVELDWAAVSSYLSDAVIFLDGEDKVCGFNPAAQDLYRKMGYIDSLMGMPASNIQLSPPSECDSGRHESTMVGRTMQYRRVPLSPEGAGSALIIHDVSEQRRLERELELQRTALRELRHRMKNSIRMISDITRERCFASDSLGAAQAALLDTANRLLSLTMTLDGIVQTSLEKVSLLQVLEHIRRYTLQTVLTPAKGIAILVRGEDIEVSADCATSVALVVNELIQNALRYAFTTRNDGVIGIELQPGCRPLCSVTVWDNGVGFCREEVSADSIGLELAATIVREKLIGEWTVVSNESGTSISFDFLEK